MSHATVVQLAFPLLGVMSFHVFEDKLYFLVHEPSVYIVASNCVLEYLIYKFYFLQHILY